MRKLFFIIVTAIGMMQIPMQSINAQNMKKEEAVSYTHLTLPTIA